MEAIIFGLFGLIVGSFLNVVILRFGCTVSAFSGRSACPHCHATLLWFDLIPVLSYVLLRGKCRSCGSRISPQYVIVESATAVLFFVVGFSDIILSQKLLLLGVIAIALCIFVYDLRYKKIPIAWTWIFIVLSAAFGFFITFNTSGLQYVWFGPISALPILFLWYLSKPFTGQAGQWMGFGDVKLALGIGWLLPWQTELGIPFGIVAIFLAFIIGAVVSVTILLPLPHLIRIWGLRSKNKQPSYTMKSEVPFGPFLVTSCLTVLFAVLYHLQIPIYL